METTRIADELRRSLHGEAWHGPSLREALAGVTAKQALAKPIAGAHSIWELVLHVTAWAEAAQQRLAGQSVELSGERDFPTPSGDWNLALDQMDRQLLALEESAAALPHETLTGQVPGRDYDNYFLLHGIAQHNAYHAGQIVILKKALGT